MIEVIQTNGCTIIVPEYIQFATGVTQLPFTPSGTKRPADLGTAVPMNFAPPTPGPYFTLIRRRASFSSAFIGSGNQFT